MSAKLEDTIVIKKLNVLIFKAPFIAHVIRVISETELFAV